MAACKRQNIRDKLPEKLIRVHKHRKVTAIDRHKLFVRSFDCTEILPCERGRSRKVLGSLEEKHGHCKLKPKILRGRRCVRGCWMSPGDGLASAVGVVKSSVRWKKIMGTANSSPRSFGVEDLVCGTRRSPLRICPSIERSEERRGGK